jgi:hypothetical protein
MPASSFCQTMRQEQVWPSIAEWFGLEPGPPLRVPLAVLMPKHEDTWRAVQQEHDTKARPAPAPALPLCVVPQQWPAAGKTLVRLGLS